MRCRLHTDLGHEENLMVAGEPYGSNAKPHVPTTFRHSHAPFTGQTQAPLVAPMIEDGPNPM
jgi:hypothetical protein